MESNFEQASDSLDKVTSTEADMASRISADILPTQHSVRPISGNRSYVKALNDAFLNAVKQYASRTIQWKIRINILFAKLSPIDYNINPKRQNHNTLKEYGETLQSQYCRGKSGQARAEMSVVIVRDLISHGRISLQG